MGRRAPGPALLLALIALLGSGCGSTRAPEFEDAFHRAYPADTVPAGPREEFWALVGSDLPAFLPHLRRALREEPRDPRFAFEGAGFLAEHGEGPGDFQLAVDVLAGCRPEEETGGAGSYFELCRRLAREDVDATPAILRILRQAPTPGMEGNKQFRQSMGGYALRLFLANGEDRWVSRLAEEVRTETDRPTAIAMVDCLSYAVTPEADAALKSLAAGTDGAAMTRSLAAMAPLLPGRAPLPRKTRMNRTREEFEQFLDGWMATGQAPTDIGEGDSMTPFDFLYLVEAKDAPRIRSLRRRVAPNLVGCSSGGLDFLTILLRRAEVLAASGTPATAAVPPPGAR